MSVRRTIPEYDGLYFITITCSRWLALFEIANAYSAVYKWFDYLKSKGHYITGYVIMPNHIHALIGFSNTKGKSINSIIGNGKRFMSYDIVELLEENGNHDVLQQLASFVNATDRLKGKLHEVFEPSFDWKECTSIEFTEQKLNYIHANPCRAGLVATPEAYVHSSAKYYYSGESGVYGVTNYMELQDIDLTKPV
jgi:REP element-mobilizing transposase RayT